MRRGLVEEGVGGRQLPEYSEEKRWLCCLKENHAWKLEKLWRLRGVLAWLRSLSGRRVLLIRPLDR